MSAGQANHLALVGDTNASENAGDDSGNAIAPIEIDPNAVSDLNFRMRVSLELATIRREAAKDRAAINRILTRFATLGQPIPNGDVNVAL